MTGGSASTVIAAARQESAAGAALAFLAGVGAAVLLLVLGVIFPAGVARAWLAGFLFWLGLPTGALLLELMRSVTGGRWGAATNAALLPVLRAMPLALLLVVPLLLTLPFVYPWVGDPSLVQPDVGRYYLTVWAFALRFAVILAIWSLLAWLVVRGAFAGRPALAGAALIVMGITFSIGVVDWFLALAPGFKSTAFPMFMAAVDLMMALAWTALLLPPPALPHRLDVARMMAAASFALLYLAFIQYLVIWAGDLPEEVGWYLDRSGPIWLVLLVGALLLAVILPACTMLVAGLRRSSGVIVGVGGLVLVGLALDHLWLVLPAFGPPDGALAFTAVLALLAIGGLWLGLAYGGLPFLLRAASRWRSHER